MAQGCAGCLILILVLALIGAIMSAVETLAQGVALALPLAIICGSVVAIVWIVMKGIGGIKE